MWRLWCCKTGIAKLQFKKKKKKKKKDNTTYRESLKHQLDVYISAERVKRVKGVAREEKGEMKEKLMVIVPSLILISSELWNIQTVLQGTILSLVLVLKVLIYRFIRVR